MIIKARIKSNNVLCGYLVEHGKNVQYINKVDAINKVFDNAIRLKNGTYKAKDGYRIETKDISEIDIIINNRHTSVMGKPSLIFNTTYGKLSLTQRKILNKLQDNNIARFDKSKENISINMKDLSALTAFTGKEFSLFQRNDLYIVAKGTEGGMHLDTKISTYLINNKFTWVGHTHPGNDFNCMMPSDADYSTLKAFNQKRSMVYNSVGHYYIFGLEE